MRSDDWKIVIIDDNPEDRREIRRLLLNGSGRRYQFIEAENGAAGVQEALAAAPDCVLLDYFLPDMSAAEVLAALAGSQGTTICPIVVVTGSDNSELGRAMVRAGAQDFLDKGWMGAQSLTRAVENAAERWTMAQDLQDRAEALQFSQQQLQLAVEVSGLGVSRIDYGTQTVVLDTVAAALFGLRAGAALPRSAIHATFHPDDADEIFRRMNQSLDPRGDGWFVLEHRVVHRDGAIRWLSVKKRVMFGDVAGIRVPVTGVLAAVDITARKQTEAQMITMNGQLIVASVRQHELTEKAELLSEQLQADLTARKKIEEALRRSETQERASRAQAEAANASKDTFLATLSHELRTPLNAILGWAVLLRTTTQADGKPVNADIDRGLAVIERNARVQGKLIEDVLDVARITSGKFMLDSRPLDLTSLVFAAVDAVRPAAKGKGLKLRAAGGGRNRVEGGSQSVWVNGDWSRLQQAVSNLLTNAIKFTPDGGRVAVRVERVKGADAGTARITVTDTGMGIDAAFLPSVFERFKQAGVGTTRSYGGLGLGLSVVRHIMEAHGGTALAMSQGAGKGATFTLELPAMSQTATPPQSDTPISTANPPRLDGVRVLVVDDEEDLRVISKLALETAGATVLLATSAEEGYQLAMNGTGKAAEVRVVVSDIGMPGEDGYSMIRRVRTQKSGEDLPALAMTAFAAPEDKRRALVAGFQAHMAKPIDPHELIAVVAGLVGGAERATK